MLLEILTVISEQVSKVMKALPWEVPTWCFIGSRNYHQKQATLVSAGSLSRRFHLRPMYLMVISTSRCSVLGNIFVSHCNRISNCQFLFAVEGPVSFDSNSSVFCCST